MATLDEVVVDEVRFRRMFNTLRRGGMYRNCGCAGCPPCRNAAQRLLRGIARSGSVGGLYRPQQWGNRYRIFTRPLGSRVVSVLADMSAQPTVVDVNVDSPNDVNTSAAMSTGPYGDTLNGGTPGMGGPSDAMDEPPQDEVSLGTLLSRRLPSSASAALRGYVQGFSSPVSFQRVQSIANVPTTRGLYVLQWSTGQYLGKADNLRQRLAQHQGAMRRYGLNPFFYQMFVANTGTDPRPIEHGILTKLAQQVGGVTQFSRLGMTNKNTELEFF